MIRGWRVFHIFEGHKHRGSVVIGAGRFTRERFRTLKNFRDAGMRIEASRHIYR